MALLYTVVRGDYDAQGRKYSLPAIYGAETPQEAVRLDKAARTGRNELWQYTPAPIRAVYEMVPVPFSEWE